MQSVYRKGQSEEVIGIEGLTVHKQMHPKVGRLNVTTNLHI